MIARQLDPLIARVQSFIEKHRLIKPSDTIIIGLSGGPDSVFLLHALSTLRPLYTLTLIAAHLDHEWRENSACDTLFCQQLAQSLNITFVSARASEIRLSRPPTGSREELGRMLRRAFFEKLAQEKSASKIALAHQRDDQIETFFIRLYRGTGLSGLASIRPVHGIYIHPLLGLSKAEIIAYLQVHNLPYLIDYTNTSQTFLRNRIRNNLVPTLEQIDSRFTVSCIRSIENLQEADNFLEKLAQDTLSTISYKHKSKLIIDLKKFRALEPFMQKRVILSWLITEKVAFTITSSFFHEILRFLLSQRGGAHKLSPDWKIIKKEHKACIEYI
jgi:tRNA(Ile)-lysidine synthase